MTNGPSAPLRNGCSADRISRGGRRRLHPTCGMPVSGVAKPCPRFSVVHLVGEPIS